MSSSEIFGPQGKGFIALIGDIVPKLTGESTDWDLEKHRQLIERNPSIGQREYWIEILGRCYIASAGTIVRAHQWIQAVIIGLTALS